MSGPSTYRVRPGDTLSTIALRQGIALELLVRFNHLSDANRIYVDQVLQLEAPSGSPSASEPETSPAPRSAPGPGLRHTPAAPASTAPGSLQVEDFLSPTRGSHSLAAIVIGCAEGNRTPHGELVWSSFGHTDPGNGKRNLGSFSSQMTPERAQIILGRDAPQRQASQLLLRKADRALSTKKGRHQLQELLEGHPVKELLPEVAEVDLEGMRELIDRADRLQLEAMSGKLSQYTAAARGAGLDPNHPLLIATYFDSFNQSEAASSRLLKQFSFIKAQKQGITQETVLAARVRSWIDPNTQKLYTHLDKKTHEQKEYGAGFKNIAKRNKQSLTQVIQADQGRRVGEMVRALAQWGGSAAVPSPAKTRSPTSKSPPPPPKAQPSQGPPSPSGSKGSATSSTGLLSTLPPRLAEIAQGQRVLVPGSKDSLVTQLQSLLTFCMPQWSDRLQQEWGRFGQSTQGAVSEMQRANKLPSATGALNASTLELLKFDVYARYFQLRGAALDTRINIKTLVGLRVPTSTQANAGKGIYDDRFALLWREGGGRKRVKEFLANTDPAGEYLAKGYGADVDHKNGKELGRLKEGYYVYHKSTGYNGWLKGKPVLRSKGQVPLEFDVNHDGHFNKLDAIPGRSPTADDILIHAGSRHSTGSAGCMTLPPDEFQNFWASLGTQEEIKYLLVTLDAEQSTLPSPWRSLPIALGQKGHGPTRAPPKGARPAPELHHVASGKAVLYHGMAGQAVTELRDLLSGVGHSWQEPLDEAREYFSSHLKDAIATFQQALGLQPPAGGTYGSVGKSTLDVLKKARSHETPSTQDPRLKALPKTGNAYFDQYAADAIRSQRATGVPASVTLAQGTLESSAGNSLLSKKYHNHFGIKGKGPLGSVTLATHEVIHGKTVKVFAPFRIYASAQGSFEDHGKFLTANKRYAEALRHKDDAERFAQEIQKAGYATGKKYAESLIKIIRQYDLTRFDRFAGSLPPTSAGTTPDPGPSSSSPSERTATPAPSLQRVAEGHDVLSFGMRGPAVLDIQQLLVRTGDLTEARMKMGPGIFGPATEAAVMAFQRRAKLTLPKGMEGVVSKTTLDALRKAKPTSAQDTSSTRSGTTSRTGTRPSVVDKPSPNQNAPQPSEITTSIAPGKAVEATTQALQGANAIALTKLATAATELLNAFLVGNCAKGVSITLGKAGYKFNGDRPRVASGIVGNQAYDYFEKRWVKGTSVGNYVINKSYIKDGRVDIRQKTKRGKLAASFAEANISAKFFGHTLRMLGFKACTPLLKGGNKDGPQFKENELALNQLPEGAVVVFGPSLATSLLDEVEDGHYRRVGGSGHAGHVGVLKKKDGAMVVVSDGGKLFSGGMDGLARCLGHYEWAMGYVPTTEPVQLTSRNQPKTSLV